MSKNGHESWAEWKKQAEIGRLNGELEKARAKYEILQMLLEAEIPATKTETAKQNIELKVAAKSKDKLIDQMREALRLAKDGLVCADYSGIENDVEEIEAALEAAERGK